MGISNYLDLGLHRIAEELSTKLNLQSLTRQRKVWMTFSINFGIHYEFMFPLRHWVVELKLGKMRPGKYLGPLGPARVRRTNPKNTRNALTSTFSFKREVSTSLHQFVRYVSNQNQATLFHCWDNSITNLAHARLLWKQGLHKIIGYFFLTENNLFKPINK